MGSRKTLLTIIAAAFLIKLLTHLLFIDSIATWEDNATALNLLYTGELKYFHDGAWNYNYQFPLYCWIQFAAYKLFGIHNMIIIVIQLLITSITAFLLHDVFSKLLLYTKVSLNEKAMRIIPLLAATGYLFHPLIAYYAIAHIHPLGMDMLMAVLVMHAGLRYYKSSSVRDLIFTGIVTGIALLERATLITALLPVLLLILKNVSLTKFLIQKIIILFIASIIVLPYLYRNHELTSEWSLSSAAGRHLWVGSLEETEGSNMMQDGKSYHAALPPGIAERMGQMSATQQDSVYRSMYLQKLKSEPSSVVKMFFAKLKNFWWFRANAGEAYGEKIKDLIPVYKIAYAIMLLLAFAAMLFLRLKSIYFLVFPVSLSLLQSFFYVETRHRFIIEPFLLFLALTGIYTLRLYLQKRKAFVHDGRRDQKGA